MFLNKSVLQPFSNVNKRKNDLILSSIYLQINSVYNNNIAT